MGRILRTAGAVVAVVVFAVALRLLGPRAQEDVRPTPVPSVAADAIPGAAPISIAGAWACPSAWSYAAYASPERRSFAPNHPEHPAESVEPDRCYATEEDARRDGYEPGLVEPNTLEVEGLYLVPVDLQAACARAANRLGFAVPCATRLPNPRMSGDGPGCGRAPTRSRSLPPAGSGCVVPGRVPAFLFAYSAFAVPADYQMRTNLVMTAFRSHARGTDGTFDYAFLCTEGRPRGPSGSLREPGPVRGRFVQCPNLYPPPLAGQLILRWTEDGVVYQVSLSNDTATNRRLLESLIRTSIVLVPPQ